MNEDVTISFFKKKKMSLWRISTDLGESRNEKYFLRREKSRGVTFGPEPGDAVVLFSILQVLCGDASDERIGGIAVRQ